LEKVGKLSLYCSLLELQRYFFNSLQNPGKEFEPNSPIKFKKSYAFSHNLIILNAKKSNATFFASEEEGFF
jgi:hypothetical protein